MLHMTDIRSWRWRNRYGISYNESECRVAEAVRVIYSTGEAPSVTICLEIGYRSESIQDFVIRFRS
jgi:hypothetical protein